MLPFYLLCRKDIIYVWNDYEIILHDLDKYKVENLTLKRDTSYSEMIVLFQSFAICFQFAHKDGLCWEVVLRNLQLNARRSIFNWTEFNILSDIIDIYIFFFLHVDLNDSFKKKWQLLTIEKWSLYLEEKNTWN